MPGLFGQVFKGVVLDSVSQTPLVGVNIALMDESGYFKDGVITGIKGEFSLPLEGQSKYIVDFTYIGTHSKSFTQTEIESFANQEVIVLMFADRQLLDCELIIRAPVYHFFSTDKIDQLSIDGNHRGFAASFNDPIRSLIRFPGASAANDQANGIVYRGLPNEMMSWRMDGAEIVSPNHLSSAGTATDRPAANSGGVMSIPFEALDNYEFHQPNYSKTYGNAISGFSNLTPVKSVSSKPSFFKFGFLGAEAALSKRFDAKPGFGFHELYTQYRYSFTGLLNDLGVELGDEEIRYQDIIFTSKLYEKDRAGLTATFNYGKSSNLLEVLGKHTASTLITGMSFSDRFNSGALKHQYSLYYSSKAYTRELLFPIISILDPENIRFIEDLIVNDQSKLSFHGHSQFEISDRLQTKIGTNLTHDNGDVSWTFLNQITNQYTANYFGSGPDFHGNVFFGLTNATDKLEFSPELSWAFTSDELFIPEGRLKLKYRLGEHQAGFTVSKNSKLPDHALYALLSETTSNNASPVFSELNAMKSVGADFSFNYLQYAGDAGQHIRINLFYQYLYDLPISTTGRFEPFTGLAYLEPTPLVGDGEAKTYGIDVLYHRAFGDLNLNLNTSVFDAKYSRQNTDIIFDSPYNYGYTFNALLTYLWKPKSKLVYTSLAFHTRGGAFVPDIDSEQSIISRRSIYTTNFMQQDEAYARLDLRLRYEFGKNQLILDIQNVLNKQNVGFDYFDAIGNEIRRKDQLGMIPVLSYKRLFDL